MIVLAVKVVEIYDATERFSKGFEDDRDVIRIESGVTQLGVKGEKGGGRTPRDGKSWEDELLRKAATRAISALVGRRADVMDGHHGEDIGFKFESKLKAPWSGHRTRA